MIPEDCKRLAEVDFPIAEVSRYSVAENSIRRGHPKTLHLWWARRPLASSRAMLLGLLWPDPCHPLCPRDFKESARKLLRQVGGCNPGVTDLDLRTALLKFIAKFANWDLASNRTYLEISRALMKVAHGEEPPLVVDHFAGGGSIPLEALRLGCEAFASDLNPVACLILKAILEDIPRQGPKLAEELRRVGEEIRRQVEHELADLYPKASDGATPIAYLWARTVRCEAPNCGAEIPLVRSFWLCKKAKRKRALRYRVVRSAGEPPRMEFEVFEPKTDREVPASTVSLARASCAACGAVLPPERVRSQLTLCSGGADVLFDEQGRRRGGAILLAVVSQQNNSLERQYRLAALSDYDAVRTAQLRVIDCEPGRFPDEPIVQEKVSKNSPFRMHLYGYRVFRDLFTARQKIALATLQSALQARSKSDEERTLLALSLGKAIRHWNAFAKWHRGSETVAGSFALQAISMSWDFPEMYPFTDYAGGLDDSLNDVIGAVDGVIAATTNPGQVHLMDACEQALPDGAAACWFTDPPYYDAIPYSDISDAFYAWHKRSLPGHPLLTHPYDAEAGLTPKGRELIQDDNRQVDGRFKDKAFFEERITAAFEVGRRELSSSGIGCVVFAHKTTEGWEALLSGMIAAGWTVTGSWPIATERGARLRARDSAALGTSVHLVCRPRSDDAGIGDWASVLRELPQSVRDWMERLQGEGVRGADLVFACIGPALEIFSRYAKVETAEGREIDLPAYLEKVWEVVGRSALAQVLGTAEASARNGAVGAVEEDARLTALFLWTLQSTNGEAAEDTGDEEEAADDEDDDDGLSRGKAKGFTLVHDVVRRFAQPLGIDLPKWEGRVIETKKGIVRLLPIGERAKQLFGEDGAQAVAARLEQEAVLGANPLQGMLFPELEAIPKIRGHAARSRGGRMGVEALDQNLTSAREATTLDRVHAAMLLQASGRTNALRALLKAELDVEPQEVVLGQTKSADRRLRFYPTMGSMPVISFEPMWKFFGAAV
jgi:putative DNA methylase